MKMSLQRGMRAGLTSLPLFIAPLVAQSVVLYPYQKPGLFEFKHRHLNGTLN